MRRGTWCCCWAPPRAAGVYAEELRREGFPCVVVKGSHLQPGAGGEAHGAPGAGRREPVGLARPVRGALERVVRAFRGRLPGADHGPRRGIGRVSAPPAPVRPHGRRGWRRRRGAVASAGRGRAHRGEDGARHGTDAPVGHHGRDGARFRLVLAHGAGGCRRTGARGERAEGGPHGRGRRACGRGGPGERGRAPGRAGGGGQGGARRAFRRRRRLRAHHDRARQQGPRIPHRGRGGAGAGGGPRRQAFDGARERRRVRVARSGRLGVRHQGLVASGQVREGNARVRGSGRAGTCASRGGPSERGEPPRGHPRPAGGGGGAGGAPASVRGAHPRQGGARPVAFRQAHQGQPFGCERPRRRRAVGAVRAGGAVPGREGRVRFRRHPPLRVRTRGSERGRT